ncbi:MAG: sialate O-acetylesterase [Sumerlaeia bacterium]
MPVRGGVVRLFVVCLLGTILLGGCRTTGPMNSGGATISPQAEQPDAPLLQRDPFRGSGLQLPEQFTDGLVLQRDVEITFWGWDEPGQQVLVVFAGHEASAVADEEGKFSLVLPSMSAGGPYSIFVSGSSDALIRNVLVGDVWFCIGQSNMQWGLLETKEAGLGFALPDDELLRIFSVEKRPAGAPQSTVRGLWQPSVRRERESFSAVAFYFGSELRTVEPAIPIGIYEASLNGSAIEPWMPAEAFEADSRLQLLAKRAGTFSPETEESIAQKNATFLNWLNKALVPLQEGIPEELPWHSAPLNESWEFVQVPGRWEKSLEVSFDGIVWFRRSVELPADWAGEPLALNLGRVDDFDQVWFNGTNLGGTFLETPDPWAKARRYRVPGEAVVAGKNELAIRVIDFFSGGGLAGPASQMTLSPPGLPFADPIQLSGPWRYRVESVIPTSASTPPPLPNFTRTPADSPSALYNGMIAPLVQMPSKGVVWYQGESNAFTPNLYGEKWSYLQQSWRSQFNDSALPFLMVQLPGFGENLNPKFVAWAEFRELQQNLAKDDDMTRLISTLDLGDCKDVHPKRKRAIGQRLALAAKSLSLSERNQPTPALIGPHYRSSTKNADGSMLIETAGATGNLRLISSQKQQTDSLDTSFWASDGNGIFTPAQATLIGNKILVTSNTLQQIEHVRYAWANCPTAAIEDEAGLPLFPFRTDDYPESIMVFQ